MPRSPSGPVRRGQLIAPFGVGSMLVVPGGASLIIGGLDYWFRPKDVGRQVDVEEFKISEWRLQRLLGVDHFRLPADYRDSFRGQGKVNLDITIPAFRFPAWYFCPDKDCRLLRSFPMTVSGRGGRLKCPNCEKKRKTRYMFQVPFVAMCERGHIQDFPWRQWVHHASNPGCQGELHLIAKGSATLAGQDVRCDGCGKERNLAGITTAYTDGGTLLSRSLVGGGELFLCQGARAWLGDGETEKCGSQIRGSLRSASNLYFAQVFSSIYLPITEDKNLQALENILQTYPVSTLVSTLMDLGNSDADQISQAIRRNHARLVAAFSDAQMVMAVRSILSVRGAGAMLEGETLAEDEATAFRRAEYGVLNAERDDEFLKSRSADLDRCDPAIRAHFAKVMLISRLRETRVLAGFTRVFADNSQTRTERQALLWRKMPAEQDRWLPAYTVFGEGIFFEFSQDLLPLWEARGEVAERLAPLARRHKEAQDKRHLRAREITPRFVLLHTFAHVVMNQLTFECGYSSAALRERLYVSTLPSASMAGVLIYTADGDSEGTMGGLVRMGRPGNIEPVILRAIERARWCSSDPVCMEMGNSHGQGPDSCNLAACHNCALVPETACEEFNRFLDRGLLVGSTENQNLGYFNAVAVVP